MLDNQSQLNQYDAIVIGSGISGLTMALILAKEGKKVAVFERDRDVAPLIRPYPRKGCECSPGLHISGWMEQGEIVSSFFRYLNVADGVENGLIEKGIGHVHLGKNRYHIPKGFEDVEKSLLSYFPEDTKAVINYIKRVQKVNQQSFYFNPQVKPDFKNNNELMSQDQLTLQEILQQDGACQELIDLLGTLNNILIGSNAAEVPFKVHALVLGGFYRSLGFISINGIKRLLANFKRELQNFGVDVFFNSEVAEILTDDDKNAIGVTAKGHSYLAPMVIASCNPKLINNEIICKNLRPIYQRRLDDAESTNGYYVAFYKIENSAGLEVENFTYFDRDSGITIGGTFNHSGEQKLLCALIEDIQDDISCPEHERTVRAQQKLTQLENVIYDKVPDLKGKMVLLDYLKPWSFQSYTRTFHGSAYGIKQTINSLGFQHRTPIRGLYLIGQAIYPGFLGSMISSFGLACELLNANEFWQRVIIQ